MSLMIVFADSAKRMAQERLSQGFVQGEVMVRANREGDKGLVGRFIFQLGFGFNGWGSSPSGCTTSSCNAQDEIIEVAAIHD